jgi:hypothetical protein
VGAGLDRDANCGRTCTHNTPIKKKKRRKRSEGKEKKKKEKREGERKNNNGQNRTKDPVRVTPHVGKPE